ncbi:MAG: Uma2 family endonuclease [Anaerolineae bacterium]|nr:Uma2 family endonuclease [Anaerolineae bacterium]MCX8066313.1 Uma2 family endonuclease [Anaerolineae bacterium]MDW7992703.1 Uma2 family endonuclease [Anaerolineae bacterium]
MAEVQVQEAVLVQPKVEVVYLPPARVEYPESDGQPMGETDAHIQLLIYLREALNDYFRNDPNVYVAGNLFVYYVEGDPSQVVCPDVFVVKGVPKGERRIFKMWEEGKGPDVVFELTSKKTRYEDLGAKKGIYEVLGVQEYFIFDPLGEYLRPPLIGFRLTPEGYREVKERPLVSEVLGLRLEVEGNLLRLVDPRTGQRLLTPQEAYEAHRRAEQQAREEAEARRRAEEELERLRAELARLKEG